MSVGGRFGAAAPLVAAAVMAALALAGCGAGAGPGLSHGAGLRVTSAFGSSQIESRRVAHPPEGWSVMQLTEKYNTVSTSYGGGFVDAIDGHANDDAGAKKLDWFYYVNGIQASTGAASTQLKAGDQVWWDLHDWRAAESIPAVVGSFPEPFTSGDGHGRVATVIECAAGQSAACAAVSGSLTRAGVTTTRHPLSGPTPTDALVVLVGTDRQLAGTGAGKLLADAPSQSGVYARFLHRGRELELENPAGHNVDAVFGTAGLIAALMPPGARFPVWVVSGIDTAGVGEAAHDVVANRLADHFAVVVDGQGLLSAPQSPDS